MPSSLTLEDDGLFLLSAYFNGISHPPGYPLYSLLAHLSTLLPFGSIPFRVHLLSAVFASLTCALLWLLLWQLTQRRVVAYSAAFILAFSSVFWSQAIIAEVYSLNSFFTVLLIFIAQKIIVNDTSRRIGLIGFSVVYGLALTNHWPLIILSSLGLAIILQPVWRDVLKCLPLCLVALLIGLSPYLWMYLHSQSDPFVAFYGPINGLGELWFYISRQGYAGMDSSVAADMTDKLGLAAFFGIELINQAGWLVFFLALVGATTQHKFIGARLGIALTFVFVCNSLLLIAMLGFEYDEFYTAVFRVYPITAYIVLALWAALGLLFIIEALARYLTKNTVVWLPPSLALAVIISVLFVNYGSNMRSHYMWAEAYGKTVLSSLERNAVVFADDDVSFAVMAYLRYVEGIRPDVDIYNTSGFVLNNRLFRPFRLEKDAEKKAVLEFVMSTTRPVYTVANELVGFGFHDYLIYKRLRPYWQPEESEVSLNTGVLRYLAVVAATPTPSDPWTRMHRTSMLSSALPKLMQYRLRGAEGEPVEQIRLVMAAAMETFEGQVARLGFVLGTPKIHSPLDVTAAVEEAAQYYRADARKSVRARFLMYKGDAMLLAGEDHAAVSELYQQARDVWPHPLNPVNDKLGAAEQP